VHFLTRKRRAEGETAKGMSVKGLKWRGCTSVGVILLVILASILTPAGAQEPVAQKNPYLVRTFEDEKERYNVTGK